MGFFAIINRIALAALRNNTVLYWLLASFAMLATYLPFMWSAAPFIVGALLYRAYKMQFGPIKFKWFDSKEPSDKTATLAQSQPFTFDIVQPPKPAPVEVSEPDFHIEEETTHIIDPFVDLPDVYRKPVSWEKYYEPTWKRRQIDLTKVLLFTPVVRKESAGPIKLLPEFSADTTSTVMPDLGEESGSFIYS